jgi:hypothetical protein
MILEKSYSELLRLETFEDRFDYLNLFGVVAHDTFGGRRWLNQKFYHSAEWKSFRNYIIIRDKGCDLCIEDRPIKGRMYIHHINPITPDDLYRNAKRVLDPENCVLVSFPTHNALHYGSIDTVSFNVVDRKPNDTCPWKEESCLKKLLR